MRWIQGIAVAIFLMLWPACASAATLVWSDASGIRFADANGGLAARLYDTFTSRGVDVEASGRVVWTDILPTVPLGGSGRINAGNLAGKESTPIVLNLLEPAAIAVDSGHQRMFWTDTNANVDGHYSIYVAAADGSGAKPIASQASWSDMRGIALDIERQQIYFTYMNPLIDIPFPSFVGRIDYDGENFVNLVGSLSSPRGIALDLDAGQMVWADADLGKLQRAPLAGGDAIDMATSLVSPYGVAIDLQRDLIYWTESSLARGHGKIRRMSLAGGAPLDVVTGLTDPTALAWVGSIRKPGDANGDNDVDRDDLAIVAAGYGTSSGASWESGDFNSDGRVSLVDLALMQANWTGTAAGLPDSSAHNAVPEPSAAWLVMVGGAAICYWRRRRQAKA